MKIRILSDLHNEFGLADIPELPDDNKTVLVLAGDVGMATKSWTYSDFCFDMGERFQDVIYIMGNHEFYKGSITNGLRKIQDELKYRDCVNVHAVEDNVIVVGDVVFVCATLWTNFDNRNVISMETARVNMNDYHLIREGPPDMPYQRKFHPEGAVRRFLKSRDFIFEGVKVLKEQGKKVVVVTHHLPSFQSIDEQFKGSSLNGAFASELSEQILENGPDAWIHGHMHSSCDYKIGETRILCNPRGYAGTSDLNPNFNSELTIEV